MRNFIPSGINLKCNSRRLYDKRYLIYMAYVIGILTWSIIILVLNLFNHDVICTILLFIPYIIFLIGIVNFKYITLSIEKEFFTYNYLSVGLLIFLPLLTWMKSNNKSTNILFIKLVVIALIFTMLAMSDIFVKPEYISVMKHCKSILQTMSMVLLIYALYLYYISNY